MVGLAFVLDLVLGDIRQLPHPVRWIGGAATWMERRVRPGITHQKLAGCLTTLILISGTYGTAWSLLAGLQAIDASLHFIMETTLLYTTLSTRGLYDESRPVLLHLRAGNLEKARESLRWIVGRDTRHLDRKETVRATVETVAENTVDGVVAPLFYACIGGAPLALAYKCANTLDSMFGYRNERYREFGWASARFDDAANWLPARLGGPLLAMSAWVVGLNGRNAWRTMWRDGHKHLSPNAGIPEAAVAGALSVQLGGTQSYRGQWLEKPAIGTNLKALETEDIARSHRLLFAASALTLLSFLAVRTIMMIHSTN